MKNNDLGSNHRDDIADLLVMFLETLPGGLVQAELLYGVPELEKEFIGTSREAGAVEKVKTVLAEMNGRQSHVLEYITYFLHRLIGSGKLNAFELAFSFSRLVIKDKKGHTAEYCAHLPVLTRVMELIICHRATFFCAPLPKGQATVQLPSTVAEFLVADEFGTWWKLFRENSSELAAFLTSPGPLLDLLKNMAAANLDDPSSQVTAELSANILRTDCIAQIIVEDEKRLRTVLEVIEEEGVSEAGMRWTIRLLLTLFQADAERISDFLRHSDHNQKLVSRISYGNISTFMSDVIKRSAGKSELFSLISSWCVLAFDQLLVSVYSLENNTLSNSVQFLQSALSEETFLTSEAFAKFQHHLTSPKLQQLIDKALSGSDKATACEIHTAISSLIALKELSVESNIPASSSRLNLDEIASTQEMNPSRSFRQIPAKWISESSQIPDEEESDEEEDDEENDEISVMVSEQVDVDTESTFNIPIAVVESPQRRVLHRGSCSFSWTENIGSIVNSKTDIERTNLLSIFLQQHEKITSLLADGDGAGVLGRFRLGLLRIIQVTLFACDEKIVQLLAKTKLLTIFVRTFFAFPANNLAHHVIQDTVSGILQRNNDTLVFLLLLETPLVSEILRVLLLPPEERPLSYGHVLLMAQALRDNTSASTWLSHNTTFGPPWAKASSTI